MREINIEELENALIDELIAMRKEKKMSQNQMARICKISQPLLARIENKRSCPNIMTILRLIAPFNKTLGIVDKK